MPFFHDNDCGRLLHAHILRSLARGSVSVVEANDETHTRARNLISSAKNPLSYQRLRAPTGEETGHPCHPSRSPSLAAADVAARQEIKEPPFLDLAQIDFVRVHEHEVPPSFLSDSERIAALLLCTVRAAWGRSQHLSPDPTRHFVRVHAERGRQKTMRSSRRGSAGFADA